MKRVFILLMVLLTISVNAEGVKKKVMDTNKVTIEIWSDIVCPFCFIGKRKLEKAISKANAEDKIEIVWRSFQLDPTFPLNESAPSAEYLSERKGYPINQVKAMCDNLTVQAKDYGIDFHFEKALTINTLNAHRLIHWAKEFEKSDALKEAFMIAYFTLGADLSKEDNILSVIEAVELDKLEAKAILDSDKYTSEVHADIDKARRVGVRGVPFFLINNEQVISGAQQDAIFDEAVKAALQNVNSTIANQKDAFCTPEGECK